MKVFVVDPSLFTRPYDEAFCRGLAEAGAEVTLVGRPLRPDETLDCRGFSFAPLFYRQTEKLAGRGRLLKALKGLDHGRGLLALGDLVRRERPDVVHVQWLVLPALDRMGYARVGRLAPIVFTAHNSVAFHGRASSALQLLGHDAALRGFTHYVAHTQLTATHLASLGLPPSQITLLGHPPLELATERSRPGSPPGSDRVRILLFGQLKPYKGVDVLVRAGLELARRRSDFHITVAGLPMMALDGLRDEIKAAGAGAHFTLDARFLPDSDLAAYLQAADLVVFPYREIDASGALALAARQGKPIVASAVGVFAEPPAAESVRLVPAGDSAALAAAMETLIADPSQRAELARASHRLAASMLGWPAFARACLDVYRDLPRPGA
jgi:glycosyltransferase involved in cell wall biosynthesis